MEVTRKPTAKQENSKQEDSFEQLQNQFKILKSESEQVLEQIRIEKEQSESIASDSKTENSPSISTNVPTIEAKKSVPEILLLPKDQIIYPKDTTITITPEEEDNNNESEDYSSFFIAQPTEALVKEDEEEEMEELVSPQESSIFVDEVTEESIFPNLNLQERIQTAFSSLYSTLPTTFVQQFSNSNDSFSSNPLFQFLTQCFAAHEKQWQQSLLLESKKKQTDLHFEKNIFQFTASKVEGIGYCGDGCRITKSFSGKTVSISQSSLSQGATDLEALRNLFYGTHFESQFLTQFWNGKIQWHLQQLMQPFLEERRIITEDMVQQLKESFLILFHFEQLLYKDLNPSLSSEFATSQSLQSFSQHCKHWIQQVALLLINQNEELFVWKYGCQNRHVGLWAKQLFQFTYQTVTDQVVDQVLQVIQYLLTPEKGQLEEEDGCELWDQLPLFQVVEYLIHTSKQFSYQHDTVISKYRDWHSTFQWVATVCNQITAFQNQSQQTSSNSFLKKVGNSMIRMIQCITSQSHLLEEHRDYKVLLFQLIEYCFIQWFPMMHCWVLLTELPFDVLEDVSIATLLWSMYSSKEIEMECTIKDCLQIDKWNAMMQSNSNLRMQLFSKCIVEPSSIMHLSSIWLRMTEAHANWIGNLIVNESFWLLVQLLQSTTTTTTTTTIVAIKQLIKHISYLLQIHPQSYSLLLQLLLQEDGKALHQVGKTIVWVWFQSKNSHVKHWTLRKKDVNAFLNPILVQYSYTSHLEYVFVIQVLEQLDYQKQSIALQQQLCKYLLQSLQRHAKQSTVTSQPTEWWQEYQSKVWNIIGQFVWLRNDGKLLLLNDTLKKEIFEKEKISLLSTYTTCELIFYFVWYQMTIQTIEQFELHQCLEQFLLIAKTTPLPPLHCQILIRLLVDTSLRFASISTFTFGKQVLQFVFDQNNTTANQQVWWSKWISKTEQTTSSSSSFHNLLESIAYRIVLANYFHWSSLTQEISTAQQLIVFWSREMKPFLNTTEYQSFGLEIWNECCKWVLLLQHSFSIPFMEQLLEISVVLEPLFVTNVNVVQRNLLSTNDYLLFKSHKQPSHLFSHRKQFYFSTSLIYLQFFYCVAIWKGKQEILVQQMVQEMLQKKIPFETCVGMEQYNVRGHEFIPYQVLYNAWECSKLILEKKQSKEELVMLCVWYWKLFETMYMTPVLSTNNICLGMYFMDLAGKDTMLQHVNVTLHQLQEYFSKENSQTLADYFGQLQIQFTQQETNYFAVEWNISQWNSVLEMESIVHHCKQQMEKQMIQTLLRSQVFPHLQCNPTTPQQVSSWKSSKTNLLVSFVNHEKEYILCKPLGSQQTQNHRKGNSYSSIAMFAKELQQFIEWQLTPVQQQHIHLDKEYCVQLVPNLYENVSKTMSIQEACFRQTFCSSKASIVVTLEDSVLHSKIQKSIQENRNTISQQVIIKHQPLLLQELTSKFLQLDQFLSTQNWRNDLYYELISQVLIPLQQKLYGKSIIEFWLQQCSSSHSLDDPMQSSTKLTFLMQHKLFDYCSLHVSKITNENYMLSVLTSISEAQLQPMNWTKCLESISISQYFETIQMDLFQHCWKMIQQLLLQNKSFETILQWYSTLTQQLICSHKEYLLQWMNWIKQTLTCHTNQDVLLLHVIHVISVMKQSLNYTISLSELYSVELFSISYLNQFHSKFVIPLLTMTCHILCQCHASYSLDEVLVYWNPLQEWNPIPSIQQCLFHNWVTLFSCTPFTQTIFYSLWQYYAMLLQRNEQYLIQLFETEMIGLTCWNKWKDQIPLSQLLLYSKQELVQSIVNQLCWNSIFNQCVDYTIFLACIVEWPMYTLQQIEKEWLTIDQWKSIPLDYFCVQTDKAMQWIFNNTNNHSNIIEKLLLVLHSSSKSFEYGDNDKWNYYIRHLLSWYKSTHSVTCEQQLEKEFVYIKEECQLRNWEPFLQNANHFDMMYLAVIRNFMQQNSSHMLLHQQFGTNLLLFLKNLISSKFVMEALELVVCHLKLYAKQTWKTIFYTIPWDEDKIQLLLSKLNQISKTPHLCFVVYYKALEFTLASGATSTLELQSNLLTLLQQPSSLNPPPTIVILLNSLFLKVFLSTKEEYLSQKQQWKYMPQYLEWLLQWSGYQQMKQEMQQQQMGFFSKMHQFFTKSNASNVSSKAKEKEHWVAMMMAWYLMPNSIPWNTNVNAEQSKLDWLQLQQYLMQTVTTQSSGTTEVFQTICKKYLPQQEDSTMNAKPLNEVFTMISDLLNASDNTTNQDEFVKESLEIILSV